MHRATSRAGYKLKAAWKNNQHNVPQRNVIFQPFPHFNIEGSKKQRDYV